MTAGPSRIGRYEIKSRIAQGGMGDLYLAQDPNTSRLVALKVLNATLDSLDLRSRFEREARSLASLNHPNIVHIYDYGEFRDAPFIVMEYVRGETLAEAIKRRAAMGVGQKLGLMVELCSGLAQAHAAGIVHRDIKPANLMIDQAGRLKILDFGIARVAESTLTRIGGVQALARLQLGTPGYMAPEQIRGDDVDHRADIFAVGAVCYELLSYREAFSGKDTREIEREVMHGHPVPLAGRLLGLDPQIDRILSRALAKDPVARYRDATAFAEALEHYRTRLGSPTVVLPSRSMPRPHDSSRQPVRGDAAYQRALAAYREGARDPARRFAVEALAENPNHREARSLLQRIESDGRPPAPSSGDVPNALPPSAGASSGPTVAESLDATIVIRPSGANVRVPPARGPMSREPERTVLATSDERDSDVHFDETVILPPRNRARTHPAGPRPGAAHTSRPSPWWKRYERVWAGVPAFWARWVTRGQRQQPPRQPGQRPPRSRGGIAWSDYAPAVLIGLGLVFATGIVLLLFQVSAWFSPSGYRLTITKPTGGTISTSGIRCGTQGTDCSTMRRDGDRVELTVQADDKFKFDGFTGDCAPSGRTTMTQARTCGATFVAETRGPSQAKWPLTITPAIGGIVLAPGDITCGTLSPACSAELPVGHFVKLYYNTDSGYVFDKWTGDCVPTGQTQMTAPRTCSAIFVKTGPAPAPTKPLPPPAPRKQSQPSVIASADPPANDSKSAPAPQRAESQTPGAVTPPPDKVQAPPAETWEEHAKKHIPAVLKTYCSALAGRDLTTLQNIYPQVNLKNIKVRYEQYKDLTCTLSPDIKYDDLNANTGIAKVQVGMKQTMRMKLGGQPTVLETIVTAVMVRRAEREDWQIESLEHATKPKS
jgi:serine/threonine protein kinase